MLVCDLASDRWEIIWTYVNGYYVFNVFSSCRYEGGSISDYYITKDWTDIVIKAIHIMAEQLQHAIEMQKHIAETNCEFIQTLECNIDWEIEAKKECTNNGDCKRCLDDKRNWTVTFCRDTE